MWKQPIWNNMTDTMSSAGSLEMSLKDNGLIVDMSPTASILHHNTLASHAQALRSLKVDHCSAEEHSPTDSGGREKTLTPTPVTANISISPTNLSTTGSTTPSVTTFRCERCENFETTSRASLLLHVVQCLSNAPRLKAEDNEPENLQTPATTVSPMEARQNLVTVTPPTGVVTAVANGSANSSAATSSSSSSGSRKVFECDVCNMKFSNGANMRRHKMRHTGVKPYECRVCQKRFFRKDHLAEHFTTHTKTLPYHCPICNRGFQRQIAMRAHFQNEHVGQHDLVKTCPLCSYRAGSMKSLRIHFFNRHGIDLDNPGPAGSSTLLLALESQASQVAAAAAAAGFVPAGLNAVAAAAAAAAANPGAAIVSAASNMPNQSDSGESLRSVENATPPMHFLTPHVEISTLPDNGMSDNAMFNVTHNSNFSDSLVSVVNSLSCSSFSRSRTTVDNVLLCVLRAFALQGHTNNNHNNTNHNNMNGSSTPTMALDVTKERDTVMQSPVPLTMTVAPQEHPLDCNAKSLPSSTSNGTVCGAMSSTISPKTHHHENHITPSISLIPIKQEPPSEDMSSETMRSLTKTNSCGESMNGGDSSESEFSTPNSRLTSLIKVSPLKSLLREDLKRRICAKANNRITRNANAALENNNVIQSSLTPANGAAMSATSTSTPICNGTITSTGQEGETGSLNRKQILTCLFCGIEFPDETLYFLHKGCHCESNPWKCNICGEQCNNVYEFNSHLLSKSHQ
ncbi:uncharacterized protein ACN427_000950 isoform 2-T2 [Glossina fuscipes fuscipes]